MKKIGVALLILFLSFSLIACDFFFTSTESVATTFLTRTTTTTTSTTTTSTQTTATNTSSTTSTEISTPETQEPFILESYETIQDQLDVIGMPSIGEVKVLVFAIDFLEYPSIMSPASIAEIEKAFNGTSEEVTYESLRSYYQKSSYDQLDITADVYGFYRAIHPADYYEREYEKLYATDPYTGEWLYDESELTYPDSDLIFEVMEYYDDVIDYSDYDSNHDGYIDGLYLIYNHPVSYENGSDFWWAYQDVYIYEDTLFDNVEPYYFVWSGAEFFDEGHDNVNARTIIHETGHLLGLDDYYDYDLSDIINQGGLGGADMMDSGYGDQNAFSKLLLGWIHPWIVTDTSTLDIAAFEESGEAILFIREWKDTIFDEYILITFYTPTGLNEADEEWLFTNSGVIMYHVNAKIGNSSNQNYFSTVFDYNNTDTQFKLIKIIEADMDKDIDNYSYAENSDLFQVDDVLGSNVYPTYRWCDRSYLNSTIKISGLTSNLATIEITVPS